MHRFNFDYSFNTMSFNTAEILTREFQSLLHYHWISAFGDRFPDYENTLSLAASVAVEIISRSDAVFHNVEFLLQVACVGQALLKGKLIKNPSHISHYDWLHFTIATLFCNIGMVRGALQDDDIKNNSFSNGINGERISLPDGCTDAILNEHTLRRSQQFIDEYFENHPIVDPTVVKQILEVKIFPMPDPTEEISEFSSLIRTAILVGEIADTRWLQRIAQLYYEYKENGVAELLGYSSPGDLKKNYPSLFWQKIHPCISTSMPFLEATQNGQSMLSLCFANIFTLEHSRQKSNVIGFGLQAVIDPVDQEKLSEFALR